MDSSVDPSGYVRGVLQKVTPLVKDSVTYNRAMNSWGGWGRTRMSLV